MTRLRFVPALAALFVSQVFCLAAPRFYIRDMVAGSDPVSVEVGKKDGDFALSFKEKRAKDGSFLDALVIESLKPCDRCITLVAALPVPSAMDVSFVALDEEVPVGDEPVSWALPCEAGAGTLSRIPIQGVGNAEEEWWIGIDPAYPAVYRTYYDPSSRELCIAFDLGFVPENRKWELRFCHFIQAAGSGMRPAWKRYAGLYPEAFEVRAPFAGLWMHNAPISGVARYEDFSFAFKTGNFEIDWDDAHNMISFRYTEPMTWWMPMARPDLPEGTDTSMTTSDEGVTSEAGGESQYILELGAAEAARLAAEGNAAAKTWQKSVMYDAEQRPIGKYIDAPWGAGIVWSMAELPGLGREGDTSTSFWYKWDMIYSNDLFPIKEKAAVRVPGIWVDGEYTDSSEGYVTADLDFRRDHLAAAAVPLTFSLEKKCPAIFKGLVSFEYVRGIARDTHAAGRLMMANATPYRFSWLAPMLDIMGTETDWRWTGDWHPLEIFELRYRRMMCYGKPFCLIQNTDFSQFTHEMTEKYIMRCMAFGIMPGFFSQDAYTGHYFENPALYERDRDLFRKYMPACRMLAEAGWEPVTGVKVSDPRLLVERFGDPSKGGPYYVSVYNPTSETITVDFTHFDKGLEGSARVFIGDRELEPEHVLIMLVRI